MRVHAGVRFVRLSTIERFKLAHPCLPDQLLSLSLLQQQQYQTAALHILQFHLEKSGSARGFMWINPCSCESLRLGKGETLVVR